MSQELTWFLVDFFIGEKHRSLNYPILAAGRKSAIAKAKRELRSHGLTGTRFNARRSA